MSRNVVCTDTNSEKELFNLFDKEGSAEWPIGAGKEWFCRLLGLLLNEVSERFDRAEG